MNYGPQIAVITFSGNLYLNRFAMFSRREAERAGYITVLCDGHIRVHLPAGRKHN